MADERHNTLPPQQGAGREVPAKEAQKPLLGTDKVDQTLCIKRALISGPGSCRGTGGEGLGSVNMHADHFMQQSG